MVSAPQRCFASDKPSREMWFSQSKQGLFGSLELCLINICCLCLCRFSPQFFSDIFPHVHQSTISDHTHMTLNLLILTQHHMPDINSFVHLSVLNLPITYVTHGLYVTVRLSSFIIAVF